MPYKNYSDKIRYNNLHNPNRVASRNINKRVNLNGIKNRCYVCEFCGSIWNTEFHEYNGNPKNVFELCHECHEDCHVGKFNEDIIIGIFMNNLCTESQQKATCEPYCIDLITKQKIYECTDCKYKKYNKYFIKDKND